jgi:hypothetical protein
MYYLRGTLDSFVTLSLVVLKPRTHIARMPREAALPGKTREMGTCLAPALASYGGSRGVSQCQSVFLHAQRCLAASCSLWMDCRACSIQNGQWKVWAMVASHGLRFVLPRMLASLSEATDGWGSLTRRPWNVCTWHNMSVVLHSLWLSTSISHSHKSQLTVLIHWDHWNWVHLKNSLI